MNRLLMQATSSGVRIVVLLGWLAPCALAAAQDRTETQTRAAAQDGALDPHDEMIRLIQDIERNLSTIDVRLTDAGAGEVGLDDASAGVAHLLRSAMAKGEAIVKSIDRVFEIRRHHEAGGT